MQSRIAAQEIRESTLSPVRHLDAKRNRHQGETAGVRRAGATGQQQHKGAVLQLARSGQWHLERHCGCFGSTFHDEQAGPRVAESVQWVEGRAAGTSTIV